MMATTGTPHGRIATRAGGTPACDRTCAATCGVAGGLGAGVSSIWRPPALRPVRWAQPAPAGSSQQSHAAAGPGPASAGSKQRAIASVNDPPGPAHRASGAGGGGCVVDAFIPEVPLRQQGVRGDRLGQARCGRALPARWSGTTAEAPPLPPHSPNSRSSRPRRAW